MLSPSYRTNERWWCWFFNAYVATSNTAVAAAAFAIAQFYMSIWFLLCFEIWMRFAKTTKCGSILSSHQRQQQSKYARQLWILTVVLKQCAMHSSIEKLKFIWYKNRNERSISFEPVMCATTPETTLIGNQKETNKLIGLPFHVYKSARASISSFACVCMCIRVFGVFGFGLVIHSKREKWIFHHILCLFPIFLSFPCFVSRMVVVQVWHSTLILLLTRAIFPFARANVIFCTPSHSIREVFFFLSIFRESLWEALLLNECRKIV